MSDFERQQRVYNERIARAGRLAELKESDSWTIVEDVIEEGLKYYTAQLLTGDVTKLETNRAMAEGILSIRKRFTEIEKLGRDAHAKVLKNADAD